MKKILLLCLIGFSYFSCFAQAPFDSVTTGLTFQQISYQIDSILSNQGQDTSATSTYKEYQRWDRFWSNRIGASSIDADMASLNGALLALYDDRTIICDGSPSYPNSWKFSGHTENFNNRNGRLISLYVKDDLSYVLAGSKAGGLWKGTWNTIDAVYTWECLTDNTKVPSFGVHSIAVNPENENEIYIATGKFSGQNLQIGYGLGILKSTDGGNTWGKTKLTWDLANPNKFLRTRGIFYHPSNGSILFAFDGNKLYKSIDGGSNYSTITLPSIGASNHLRDLEFLPSDNDVMLLSTDATGSENAKVYKSIDKGDTWAEVNLTTDFSIPVTSYRIDIAISELSSNKFYLSFSTATGSRESKDSYLGYFDNSSASYYTYPVITNQTNDYWYNDLVCSKVNPNILYLAGIRIDRIDITNPLSIETRRINGNTAGFGGSVHADNRKLFLVEDAGEDYLFSANDGGLSFSSNVRTVSGTNQPIWTHSSEGLNVTEIFGFDVSTNGDNILYGTLDNGNLGKRNDSWSVLTGGDGVRVICNKYGPEDLFYAQQNSNRQWFFDQNLDFSRSILCEDLGLWERDMDVDNQGNFYLTRQIKEDSDNGITGSNQLFRIDRSIGFIGSTCNAAENINTTSEWLNTFVIASAPSNENIAYYGYSGSLGAVSPLILYKSSNAQDINPTWSSESLLKDCDYRWSGITDIVVDPENENHVWIVTGSYVRNDNKRVLFSDNGGENYSNGQSSWVEIHKDLKINSSQDMIFPVNTVVLDHFTGGMYIGSDIGVFYNPEPKNTNSSWHCYNKNLPSSIVTDLKIDYCNRKLLASTFGRGLWEVNLADNNTNSYDISTNTTWDETVIKIINQDIIVKSGFSLTIKSEIVVPSYVKVIVEKGAKLIIDGGKITTRCNDQWAGIYVEGDKTLAQFPFSNQGYLEIKNSGTIEHAKTAVTLCGLDVNGNEDHHKSGGILFAEDAQFIDNWRDVSFVGYAPGSFTFAPKNISKFLDCEFTTTDNYLKDASDIWPHITMWGVAWVSFQGCTFEDQRWNSTIMDQLQLRDGIFSMDASYRINRKSTSTPYGPVTVGKETKFLNLRYAIQSLDNIANSNNVTAGRPSSIVDAEFDCLGGILHSGVESAIIKRNILDIKGYFSNGPREIDAYGLYMDDCSGYNMEGNDLHSDWLLDPSQNISAGIVHTHNRERQNYVYRNYMDDYLVGAETYGENKDHLAANFDKGLHYDCNEFATDNDNDWDMWVTDITSGLPYSSAAFGLPQQGSLAEPAGNLFGQYNSTPSKHLDNLVGSSIIDYYHHDVVSNSRVIPSIQTNVTNINTGISNIFCPDNTNKLIAIGTEELDNVEINRIITKQKRDVFILLTDGGNTTTTLSQITSVTALSRPQLMTDLTNYSPYLSLPVLELLANTYTPITQEDIRDILVLNPHSGRSSSVVTILQNRTDNFPQTYLDQIDSASDIWSGRDSLLEDIYYYGRRYELELNSILRRALNTETEDLFTSTVEPLLLASSEVHHKYKLASMYDSRGDVPSADQMLASIPSSFNLSLTQMDYHTDHMAIRSLLTAWYTADKDMAHLDSGDIAQLLVYKTKTNGIQNKVLPLLVLNNATTYLPPIYNPYTAASGAFIAIKSNKETSEFQDDIKTDSKFENNNKQKLTSTKVLVYPNPTRKSIHINYSIEKDFNEASIVIYDLVGKELKREVIKSAEGNFSMDVSAHRNGKYSGKLIVDGLVEKMFTFVIAR
ncbi:MAG: hypothetical protein COA58_09685 [Bacteroidetes bacterium]|nr:MAG: hypothetical protein COA58_09685 [Bacteroidota bacterium]